MAYSLESLIKILDQIIHPDQDHPWNLDPSKKPEIESILEKACILRELFENSSSKCNEEVRSLEGRIRDAAHDAEDIVESHLADQLLSSRNGERFNISPPDLQKVIREFDVIKEEMMKIMDGIGERGNVSSLHISSRLDLNPKSILVGVSDDLLKLKARLTRQQPKLEIIPIVGMGGIGKTTLARTLYDDPLIVYHFNTCAWIVISQSYNVQEILIGLLRCVLRKDEIISGRKVDLALRLKNILWGRRYLIVLDDMWSCEAWNDIKMSFPDNGNGSRIMITTRDLSVVNDLGSQSSHHQMNFLNEVEGWTLLCKKVFDEEVCPPVLEEVGHKIAKDCGGLPLAIQVVGGLLSQLKRTKESWIQVANDVSLAIINKNEHFSSILYLSYHHLPNYLKPCFLYMANFPEDFEIQASKLIRLWVVEDFLKPVLDKTMEETANVYLTALVDRNLLLVSQQEIKGKVKSYIMHDSLRDLCIKIAREEKFVNVMTGSMRGSHAKDMQRMRRLTGCTSNHVEFISGSPNLAKVTRSVIFTTFSRSPNGKTRLVLLGPNISGLRLLKTLDIVEIEVGGFPEQIEKLVNLRYLAFAYSQSKSPRSISTLCDLQVLIIDWECEEATSYELFDMPRLKHIKFKGSYPFCDVPDGGKVALQKNLKTLSTVAIDSTFSKILEVMPNLEKLGISEPRDISISSNIDMTCLGKLKTLKCKGSYYDMPEKMPSFLSFLIFPPSIKKLNFRGCRIPLGYMERIGALPSLLILKLHECIFECQTWKPTEEEFLELQLLVFEKLNLVKWMVDDETHYPKLKHLVIRDCSELEEIPCDIGNIPTLEVIEVHGEFNDSVLESARKIQNEQLELANYDLRVHINAYAARSSSSWSVSYSSVM